MRSYLALLATFALLAGVDSIGVLSAAADAQTAIRDSPSLAIKSTASPAFSDLGGNGHREAVDWLVANGMAEGHADGTFRPADPLTRGQLASLLARSLELEPASCTSRCARLIDLESSVHAPAIRALMALGVSSGYGDGTYRPNGHVTRGQLATFMAGAFDLSLNDAEHPFTDVAGTEHEAEIAALFAAGFTKGATLTTFEPDSHVRRDQMASLLSRSLGWESAPVTSASTPEVGAPLGTTTRISQHGITWDFSGEHEYGTYANGDYWVIGPVQIEEITPNSVSGGRHMNGSMINPSPRHGSGVGYDSNIRDVGYDATRNVALDVSPSNPLTVETHSSLVSTISVPEADARPGIDTAAVLTVVDQAPADGSFRPPYSGDDKSARFTVEQLDRDLLPQLPTVAGTPDPTALAGDFERVWLDHVPGWTGRSIHPASNMPDYGRLLSASLGRGYLTLLLDFTPQEKQQMLINLVQIGIDFYGIVEDDGERNWVPNGGHAQGRKLPILFAGTILSDQTMSSIGDRDDVFFGEDAQTFYVDDDTLRVGTGYDSSHLGMPEWGIRHATDPSRDNVEWGARYRRDSTANSWHSHVLTARILGLQGAWNHDALFDYTDRYMDTEEPGQWFRSWDRPFSEAMWDTYRSQY